LARTWAICSLRTPSLAAETPFREPIPHLLHPRRPLKTPLKIPQAHVVTPALRFELTRASVHAFSTNRASKQTVKQLNNAGATARARTEYRKLQSGSPWAHPLFGGLRVTRLGWRHVTRRSRTLASRVAALRVVPYLTHLLGEMPDRYVTKSVVRHEFAGRTTEIRHVLCWYRRALGVAGETHAVLVRVFEEVSYPTDWSQRPPPEVSGIAARSRRTSGRSRSSSCRFDRTCSKRLRT
jgi:hypothetical protein